MAAAARRGKPTTGVGHVTPALPHPDDPPRYSRSDTINSDREVAGDESAPIENS